MARNLFSALVLFCVIACPYLALAAGSNEALIESVHVGEAFKKTQVTVDSHPSTEFLGYYFHLGVTLHTPVPVGQTLTLIATGSDKTTVSRTYTGNVAADSFYFVPKTVDDSKHYTISFQLVGNAEGAFAAPPPIDFTAVKHAQVILPDGAFDYVFSGESVTNVAFYAGVPVPPGGNLTLIVTDDAGFKTEGVLRPGHVLGEFSYTAGKILGPRLLTFAIGDALAPYYIPPPSVIFIVIDNQPVTLFGSITSIPVDTFAVVTTYLGAPVPEGGDLTVYVESSNGNFTSLSFAAGEYEKNFDFYAGNATGCFTLSFFLEGTSQFHFKPIPPVGFCVTPSPHAQQIALVSEPAASVWVGTPYPVTVNLLRPVGDHKNLVASLKLSDGQKVDAVFQAGEMIKTVEITPIGAGDLTISMELSGLDANNYVAAPESAIQVIAKNQLSIVLINSTTEALVADVLPVSLYLGVPAPKGVKFSVTLSSNSDSQRPSTVTFDGDDSNKNILGHVTLSAGNLDGAFDLKYTESPDMQEYYKAPPSYGLVIWTNEINADLQ